MLDVWLTPPRGRNTREARDRGAVIITTGFEHHVVGAVHEIVLHADDRETLRLAIEHERSSCRAARIVIDLTEISDFDPAGVLAELAASEDDGDRWVIRLRTGSQPVSLNDFTH